MEKEKVPSWAADTPAVPSWASAPAEAPARFADANRAQAAAANSGDRLEILKTEFAAAQQRLTDALASGDKAGIARSQGDLAGLSREITAAKGTPPAVNAGAAAPADGAASEESYADKLSHLPLPAQAAITGVLGAKAAGAAAAIPYGTYRGGKAAVEFVGSLLDRARAGKEANVATRIDPTLAESATKSAPKGGPEGWLGGRTTELTAVPGALVNQVATLKGQGPGSASYAEAQNAANIQRQLSAGAPLETWKPTAGGQVLVNTVPTGGGGARTYSEPSIQQQARGVTQLTPHIGGKPAVSNAPAPVAAAPVAAPEAMPSSFKQAVEYAKAVAKNPIAKAMTVGGSLGAAIPYAAVDWMKGDYQGAMNKMGIGAGVGATMALAPVAGKVLPPLAALAQGYDASQRTQAKDYTGAALSAAGGLGALATMAPKMVHPGLAVGTALGAPLVNLGRDWLKEHPGEIQRWMAEQGRPERFDEMGNAY